MSIEYTDPPKRAAVQISGVMTLPMIAMPERDPSSGPGSAIKLAGEGELLVALGPKSRYRPDDALGPA